ncbi:MAG TPA: bifunctional UDP-3-O-[3-hydroxymyristoyl] N-acetylglucosamine deacetylase/3-hydroxyacyl-ACP dehydratase [Gemmatimonadaceae bacterium]|nr:bifunctional UDP-3-O-[3-hydroxymyristoyl] N-acetylglucosamine deacetylase/3-hydroxyacyl-ACP dehydratase [Gemmatimonadaceae bacterium]
MSRRTIERSMTLEGVGLHLGVPVRLTFHPAASGHGIVFRRSDLEGTPCIPARVDRALLTQRRTQLGEDPVSVHTVEHVLAAVTGADVHDLLIELDAPEPPIMDGSALPFLEVLREAGYRDQPGSVPLLSLRGPVRLVDGESSYEAWPSQALDLDVSIDFPHPLIGRQQGRYCVTPASFAAELAGARTFGFVREVEHLRAAGLIKGASTANAVVLDETSVIDATLRWPDEFLRHKALDVVGDLALAGARVCARIIARKPSHRGTVQLLRAMLAETERERTVIDIEEIMNILPHRYPFLLVDRIIDVQPGKSIVGIKNVTINEPFFQGHFPGLPVMPGVLIIEAMAQVGGVLVMAGLPNRESKVVYFTSVNNVKWRRPVKPGDQLRFELELMQVRGMMAKMSGVARVDGEIVCEAEMGAMVRDR